MRSPIATTNDPGAVKRGAYVERRASGDLTRQVFQKGRDRRREPLRDEDGKVVTVKQRGREVPVLRSTPGEQRRWNKREGDFRAGRGNASERVDRELAARDVKIKGVRGRRAKDLVAMVVEGTIPGLRHEAGGVWRRALPPSRSTCKDHGARLEREYTQRLKADPKGYRHSGEAALNRERVKQVQEALEHPKTMLQAEKIVAEGERIGRVLNTSEKVALRKGVLSDEQRSRRAGLIPAAIEHLGGRHFTEEEHAKLERDALVREQAAKDALVGGKSGRVPTGARKLELQREYAAARAHRIAVSGRDPKGVEAHETAREAAQKARSTERSARSRLAALQRKRDQATAVHKGARARGGPQRAYVVAGRRFERRDEADAHAKKTGRKVNTVALTREEASRTGELAKLDRAIKAVRKEAHDAGVEARKAERLSKRTPMPKQKAAVRTAEGKRLPDEEIEEFLRRRGRDPESVAYLPHNPPGNAAFHTELRPGTRPVIDKAGPQGTRTGEAYRKGATEASADLIQQQGVKLATQINKAEQLDSLVRDRGMRHPAYAAIVKKADEGAQLTPREKRLLDRGGYMTGKEAEEFAQRIDFDTRSGHHVLTATNGERLMPMRAYADRLSESTKEIIRESHQGPNGMEALGQRLLNDRVLSPADLGVRARATWCSSPPISSSGWRSTSSRPGRSSGSCRCSTGRSVSRSSRSRGG